MVDRIELCRKLTEIKPELGVCDFDINVTHDDELKAWRINYDADGKRGLTFLDDEDIDHCLIGKECLSLEMVPTSSWWPEADTLVRCGIFPRRTRSCRPVYSFQEKDHHGYP